jgi:galactokinase
MAFFGDAPMQLLMAFQENYPASQPEWVVQAPGREMWIAALFNDSAAFTLYAADLESRVSFTYRSAKLMQTVHQRPLPRWARYPAGVLLSLREMGMERTGLEAVIAGTEPSGPRYEHAVGIVIAALWYQIHDRAATPESLLELVERTRREFIEIS